MILFSISASAALYISNIPWDGPVGEKPFELLHGKNQHSGFPTRPTTDQAVQSQKQTRNLKFQLERRVIVLFMG